MLRPLLNYPSSPAEIPPIPERNLWHWNMKQILETQVMCAEKKSKGNYSALPHKISACWPWRPRRNNLPSLHIFTTRFEIKKHYSGCISIKRRLIGATPKNIDGQVNTWEYRKLVHFFLQSKLVFGLRLSSTHPIKNTHQKPWFSRGFTHIHIWDRRLGTGGH